MLNSTLKSMGLYASKTVGDGNCMFRALSDQVWGNDNGHLGLRQEVSGWGSRMGVRELGDVKADDCRIGGARFVITCKLIRRVLKGSWILRDRSIIISRSCVNEVSLRASSCGYERGGRLTDPQTISRIIILGTYGGHMELTAFARCKGRAVKVIMPEVCPLPACLCVTHEH